MYIHEAVREAMSNGKSIRRDNSNWINLRMVLIPTATVEGMIVAGEGGHLAPRWNPDAKDLIADDWVVLPG